MKTYILPDDQLTDQSTAKDDIIVRQYQSNHESFKNRIILKQNMVIFLIDGKKTVDYPGISTTIDSGEMIFLSVGNMLTSEMVSTQNDFKSVVIYFSPEIYNRFWIKYESPIPSVLPIESLPLLTYRQDEYIRQYFNSLLLLLQKPSLLTTELKQIKLEELLLYLFHYDREKLRSFQRVAENKESLLIKLVIERHINEPITIEELAFLCNMSSSSFKRKFNQLYETSPQKWLLNRRMLLSAELLKSPNALPSQIYYKIGYQNHSSFSEAFRKHFGITPTQYQLLHMSV